MELDEEQKKNLYEMMLIQDINKEGFKPDYMHMEKWQY